MDVISMRDFSKEDIVAVLDAAEDVKRAMHDSNYASRFKSKYGKDVTNLLEGTITGTLFLENSTRTNHSSRAAVMKAGGMFDGFPSKNYTSLQKGETWADTAAMFAVYGFDAIVMRSTTEGLPRWTKEYLLNNHQQTEDYHHRIDMPYSFNVPIIVNGGDGKNQHPTQCFLDLFTMREVAKSEGKDLEGLEIALLNDLAHGRTNASIMSVADLFDFKLRFAYPHRFGPREHQLEDLKIKGVNFEDYGENFREAMKDSFIAYHSRPQKERVGKGEDLISIKRLGQINREMYDALGQDAPFLMHPKPVDSEEFEEIYHDMNFHPKNITNAQAANGVYVRIALLALGMNKIKKEICTECHELEGITIKEHQLHGERKDLENPKSGYIDGEGLVLDHIPAGMGRRLCGMLGLEREKIPKVVSDYMPRGSDRSKLKDMIKIHGHYRLTPEQQQAVALLAPSAKLNIVHNGEVIKKYTVVVGNYVEDLVTCSNEACVTNVAKEHVIPLQHLEKSLTEEMILRCNYCEITDTVPKIYEGNRFKYLGEQK